jgi:cyclic pyranopterin phosphate synthase
MPPEGVSPLDHSEIMRYEEITYLCGILAGMGIKKIRFTGGEPFVRKGMPDFLRDFRRALPDISLFVTTNGTLLSHFAESLAGLSLSGMNISVDTLNPERFTDVTRVGNIREVIGGVMAACGFGIPSIKINTVLIRGFNEMDMWDVLEFAWSVGAIPRLIEFMPLLDGAWEARKFIGSSEILEILGSRGRWSQARDGGRDGDAPSQASGPAVYYVNESDGKMVGIISAVSNHFCSSCNRLRITASGYMRACLFSTSERPLLHLIREGDSESIRDEILDCIGTKPDRWDKSRGGRRYMSRIGG